MAGWIKLHRQIKEHWVFKDPVKFHRWMLLLLEVNFKEGKFPLGNTLVIVKPGQSAKSIRTWADIFSCSTRTATQFFDLLESENMISRETIGKGKHSTTLINISNYDQFQDLDETLTDTQSKRKRIHKLPTIEEGKERVINNSIPETEVSGDDVTNDKKIDWDKLRLKFNEITGKKSRVVTESAKKKFAGLIKAGYTKPDIVEAIVNCYNNDFHKANGHKHLTLDFISRPEKFDMYVSQKKKKP